MKKIILGLCLVSLLIGATPIHAATVPPVQQTTPAQKTQWVKLILQLIAVLQEQLKVAIAQEAAMNNVGAVQLPSVIQQNTQPIVQSAPLPAPVPVLTPFEFTPTYSLPYPDKVSFTINEWFDRCTVKLTNLNTSVSETKSSPGLLFNVKPGNSYLYNITCNQDGLHLPATKSGQFGVPSL